MKRFLSILILTSTFAIPAIAQVQFVPYRPVDPNSASSSYRNQQRQQEEKTQIVEAYFVNQRGAFEKMRIKVKVVEQYGNVYVTVCAYYDKTWGRWQSTNSTAQEVDVFDSQVVKENFDYKFYMSGYGYVYF